MWHQLWPMHRGYGYLQNPLDELKVAPIKTMLREAYGSITEQAGVELYVARQWHERSPQKEATLRNMRGVTGLVFSTFRHDNPGDDREGRFPGVS